MKKLTLLLVALLLIAIPSTIAYFSGQHTYETKSCVSCHANIEQDLRLGTTVMATYDCGLCHYFIGITNFSEKGHSAVNNACNDCHPDVEDQFISNDDSHKNLYQNAISDYTKKYANEACTLCHSDSQNIIIFSRPEFIEYNIVDSNGTLTIQNFIEGNDVRNDVILNRNNGFHSFLSGVDVGCTECHTDITSAIDTGGHYPANTTFHSASSTCIICHDNYNQAGKAQHVSNVSSCTGCHNTHNGSILNSIKDYPEKYEGNFCLGCHKDSVPYYPLANSTSSFRVYLEPNSNVIII
ncbi:MAG: hypothetical protein E4G94_06015 [ANME-2 cluster archaeon]|nr:MAG: hypothetical protein E4G94_06015 [ANME-2 cluster archaeon]